MSTTEKIKILMIKKKMSLTELANKIDSSPQNLSGKFKRDNFSENELQEISEALGVNLVLYFEIPETGERV